MKEFLQDNILIEKEAKDWVSALRIASKKLLEKKLITENYIEAMIENIKTNGPYMVLYPGFILPHAKPENGVNENCLSILKLEKEVMFPDSNKIKVLAVLGSVNSDTHIDLLTNLSELLTDDKRMENIMNASTIEEILEQI